jgi:hypothetical protein
VIFDWRCAEHDALFVQKNSNLLQLPFHCVDRQQFKWISENIPRPCNLKGTINKILKFWMSFWDI